MNINIRDNIQFQHALLTYTEQLAVTRTLPEGTKARDAQEAAEDAAYNALCAVIDAATAKAIANAQRPALIAA